MTNLPLNIPTGRRYDVTGFGTNAVDHLVTVPSYPAFNTKVDILDHRQLPGGEVASTIVGLQRLGMKTSYVGRFGDDVEGQLGQASLAEEGVDISQTEIIEDARTQIAYIVIEAATGERTIMWQRDAALSYTANEAPINAAGDCRILHMTPHDTAACVQMAEAARNAGTIVSLDLDNDFDGITDLLSLVDVCIVSADLPERFFGDIGAEAGLARIATTFGCPIVGCTLGDEGSLFYVNDIFIASPARPVPGGAVDTTGAGDAFRAGFLFGLLSRRSIEDSCSLANEVAALKCRRLGARAGLPLLGELKKSPKKL